MNARNQEKFFVSVALCTITFVLFAMSPYVFAQEEENNKDTFTLWFCDN